MILCWLFGFMELGGVVRVGWFKIIFCWKIECYGVGDLVCISYFVVYD